MWEGENVLLMLNWGVDTLAVRICDAGITKKLILYSVSH